MIATTAGGNKEILEHNKTGILVESDSSDKMAEEILNLISDKGKATSLTAEAFNQVQKYDWSHIGNKYLDIYKSLINN